MTGGEETLSMPAARLNLCFAVVVFVFRNSDRVAPLGFGLFLFCCCFSCFVYCVCVCVSVCVCVCVFVFVCVCVGGGTFRSIIIMEICRGPTLRLKALNKHTHIMYIEMENVIPKINMYISTSVQA